MTGLWKRSPLTALLVVVILLAAGSAMAASGVSTLVSTPDDGAATAQGAQQPLGTLSATSPVQTLGDTGSGGALGDTGSGGAPGDDGAVKKQAASGGPGGGAAGASAGSGGDGGNLPFTGYVVIPVLLAGAGLLAFGAFMRRRTGPVPTSG